MRSLILITLALLSLSVFSQKVEIKGSLKNNNSYDSIYISTFINDGQENISTTIDSKGEFYFKIDVAATDFYKLWLDEKQFVFLVLSPGEKIKFSASTLDMFNTYEVEGSYHTSLFYEANKEFAQFQYKKDSLNKLYNEEVRLITLQEQNFALNFVKKNLTSISALMYIDRVDKEQHFHLYKALDSALMLNYPTNKLVNDYHQEIQKMSFLAINSTVPDIELKDINGNKVAIKDLRGKIVLLDFWATWCGPCKAEIPNLKRTYKAYKDKGFEIYSVSLDRQKNKWEEEQKTMPWINVLDEGGKVAQEFQVMSIPFTMLIDKEGKIIAKNLRGSELYMRVSDLLD